MHTHKVHAHLQTNMDSTGQAFYAWLSCFTSIFTAAEGFVISLKIFSVCKVREPQSSALYY